MSLFRAAYLVGNRQLAFNYLSCQSVMAQYNLTTEPNPSPLLL